MANDRRRRDHRKNQGKKSRTRTEPAPLPSVEELGSTEFFHLRDEDRDPARVKREREKARRLRKSDWWQAKVRAGICHYCGNSFRPDKLTMDHVVPIARGGESTKANLVPSCQSCNQEKKLKTPVEELLEQIRDERESED